MAQSSLDRDLLACKHEQPSPQCLLRVKKDIADFFAKPPAGLFIFPEQDDITQVNALVVGPADTAYDGGFFHFFLKFPPDYPVRPPRVRNMTTDAGRVGFHPNLYSNGKVCRSILGTFSGPAWSPAQCLESILISIQSLMNADPFYNIPFAIPGCLSTSTASSYKDNIQYQALRMAVCDNLKASLDDSPQFQQGVREQILKSFSESYDKYEAVAKKNLHLIGAGTNVLSKGGFDYKNLLERLHEHNKLRKKKIEDGAGQANQ